MFSFYQFSMFPYLWVQWYTKNLEWSSCITYYDLCNSVENINFQSGHVNLVYFYNAEMRTDNLCISKCISMYSFDCWLLTFLLIFILWCSFLVNYIFKVNICKIYSTKKGELFVEKSTKKIKTDSKVYKKYYIYIYCKLFRFKFIANNVLKALNFIE